MTERTPDTREPRGAEGQGRHARWSEDGEPTNVEAAIADALEWLEVLRVQPIIRRDMENEARLREAMLCLAAYGDRETWFAYRPEARHG